MLYLGMAGRCGEQAEDLYVVRPRRKRGDKRTGWELSSRTVISCGLFGGLATGKSSLTKALAGRGYGEALHGRLMAAGGVVVGGEQRVLVIQEVGLREGSGVGGRALWEADGSWGSATGRRSLRKVPAGRGWGCGRGAVGLGVLVIQGVG